MNIVLLGAPGSGKGTQAKQLQVEFGLAHIASGDLLRGNLYNKTKPGLVAREYMEKGALVPDEITLTMLSGRLQAPDVEKGVIFDGFPRNLSQAKALNQMLAALRREIDSVLYIKVSYEELVNRLAGRWVCSKCQLPFHIIFNPFRTCPHSQCKGEHLYQRDDDKPETIKARLKTFNEQTIPVIDYYRKAQLLTVLPGEGSVEEVKQAALEAVRNLRR